MRRLLSVCLLLALAATGFAQKNKKKSEIPQSVVVAQFVYVTSFHGDRFDRRTTYEDRQAITNVEEAVQKWGRYRIALRPDEADIMLVVRPGEMAASHMGVGIPIDVGGTRIGTTPSGTPTSTGPNIGAGGDISNAPDDMLLVSLRAVEPANEASFVWRRSQHNGLFGRNPGLLQEFRKQVEEAEKQAKKP